MAWSLLRHASACRSRSSTTTTSSSSSISMLNASSCKHSTQIYDGLTWCLAGHIVLARHSAKRSDIRLAKEACPVFRIMISNIAAAVKTFIMPLRIFVILFCSRQTPINALRSVLLAYDLNLPNHCMDDLSRCRDACSGHEPEGCIHRKGVLQRSENGRLSKAFRM